MARRQHLLVLAAFVAAGSAGAFAQNPEPDASPMKRRQAARAAANSPEIENVRRAIEALTPEQRQRFKENFLRWSNLSPEEKKSLRDRDELRRKRMNEEIERAVRDAGLTLDAPQRQAFARRYAEERRRIEEQLRRETEEKRKPLVRDMVARLKGEFSSTAADTSSPSELPAQNP
jgi:hypothetical protein